MNIINTVLLIITVLLTIASPVMAGNREGAFTLSPFFGAQGMPVGEDHLDADFKWGIRGGYNFTRNLGVEFVYGESSTVHDPEIIHCRVYQYGADILYNFWPDKDFVHFVAAGFGGFTVDYNYGLADYTSAYFNYGVGAAYSLTDWLALRADFRHAIIMDTGDSALEGMVGLKFQFGGR